MLPSETDAISVAVLCGKEDGKTLSVRLSAGGIVYVVRGGIQWRMLPADFPKWQLVYYDFSVWKKPDENGVSLLDRVLKKSVKIIHENHLKKEHPSLGH